MLKDNYEDILNKYESGVVLEDIAKHYKVTRQAVSSLLRSNGVTKDNKGANKRKQQRQNHIRHKRSEKYLKKLGITVDYWEIISKVEGQPLVKYRENVQRAKSRGIGFYMSFRQWWDVWRKSGKWSKRGRSCGEYVMSRYNDKGPYDSDNVYINTCEENHREYIKRLHSSK